MSNEFSRRIDVFIIKDEPKSRMAFAESPNIGLRELLDDGLSSKSAVIDAAYAKYLEHFQPYRWVARSHGNSKIIAHGESYFNEADCRDNIALNYGDNTTAYVMPMFGDDRSQKLLRYGATDRATHTNNGYTPSGMDEFARRDEQAADGEGAEE